MLTLISRLVIGFVLAAAGSAKILSGRPFTETVRAYGFGPDVSRWIGRVLPILEVIIGLALIAGIGVREAAIVAGLLFAAFSAAIARRLLKGHTGSCGCGARPSSLHWRLVTRNVLFIVLSLLVWYGAS